jgi:hypothetical protein
MEGAVRRHRRISAGLLPQNVLVALFVIIIIMEIIAAAAVSH